MDYMNKCEHVWNEESFDATKDILEIELTHVMIQIKCEKCDECNSRF